MSCPRDLLHRFDLHPRDDSLPESDLLPREDRSLLRTGARGLRTGVACLLLALAAHAQTISNGSIEVTVDAHGVLVGVTAAGLHTFDGPRAVLGPGLAEWSGVA